jgi:hypothetical protein
MEATKAFRIAEQHPWDATLWVVDLHEISACSDRVSEVLVTHFYTADLGVSNRLPRDANCSGLPLASS